MHELSAPISTSYMDVFHHAVHYLDIAAPEERPADQVFRFARVFWTQKCISTSEYIYPYKKLKVVNSNDFSQ